ncbi:BPTI/Kunitz-type proteinase inhibitor domain-containing protein [Salmonella sp. s54925]|uniref:BPTI/Kunitz-type proteinase inhibitor domain-containing protein n=1 Tax=Salmonella sp. s54925 TaxID=3159674 RepID=UPI00397ED61B
MFIYGGCGGNKNRYQTKSECEADCKVDCTSKPETGRCRGYFPQYYYDQNSKECKKFIYGGCGGNKNNFDSYEECRESCM